MALSRGAFSTGFSRTSAFPSKIVGASAGAMNAVVTTYGLTLGGNEGARRALCADSGKSWPKKWGLLCHAAFMDRSPDGAREPGLFSRLGSMMDILSRMLSPYQTNPVNFHPLRDILSGQINFETLRQSDKVKLFVCASNVITNRLRVFERHEMCIEAVLASACLPFMFQAVEIGGEYYSGRRLHGQPADLPAHLQLRLAPTWCSS